MTDRTTPRPADRPATFADWMEGARPHTWANAFEVECSFLLCNVEDSCNDNAVFDFNFAFRTNDFTAWCVCNVA